MPCVDVNILMMYAMCNLHVRVFVLIFACLLISQRSLQDVTCACPLGSFFIYDAIDFFPQGVPKETMEPPKISVVPRRSKARVARSSWKWRYRPPEKTLTNFGLPREVPSRSNLLQRRSTVMPIPSKLTMIATAEQTSFWRGSEQTCNGVPRDIQDIDLTSFLLHRLMIIVFTSTAFTNWVATHVTQSTDATFNPYLSFLFFTLCVLSPSLMTCR
jgi:hypothetical protein